MRVAMTCALILAATAGANAASVEFQPQVRGLGCLKPQARAMVSGIVRRIGAIEITSTCGGRHASHSQHYAGRAVDFRPLAASPRAAAAALRTMPAIGGIGTYSNGLVHADVGPERAAWHRGGRRGVRLAAFHGHARRHVARAY